MGKNFKIIPQGPLIPEGVNQKSFVSVKVIPGQESVFRNGMVAKMTSGALRIRDADEKKGGEVANNKDIIEFYGDARGLNEHRDDHAACRVFTSNSYKPTPSKTK